MGRIMTCTFCGLKGHNKRGCPDRKAAQEQANVVTLHPVKSISNVDVCVDVKSAPPNYIQGKGNFEVLSNQISMMLRLQEDTMKLLKFLVNYTLPKFHASDIPYSRAAIEEMAVGTLRVIATQWLSESEMPWHKPALVLEVCRRKEYESKVLMVAAKYSLTEDQSACAILIADDLKIPIQEALGLV